MAQSEGTVNEDRPLNPWDMTLLDDADSFTANRTKQFMVKLNESIKTPKLETGSEIRSSRTNRSRSSRSKSKASSHASAVSSRKIEAIANAAALKVKLQYLDEESKMKAKLEKLQTRKALHIAESQIEALTQIEEEGSSSSSSKGLPVSDGEKDDYVREYVESIQRPSSSYVDLSSADAPEPVTKRRTSQIETMKPEPVQVPEHYYPVVKIQASQSADIQSEARVPPSFVSPTLEPPPSKMESQLNPDSMEFKPRGEACNKDPTNNTHQLSDSDQLQIFKLFADQINLGRLPSPEPGIFTGNPMDYPTWSVAFDTLIEQKRIPPAERLYHLKKYLAGEAKETVEGYLLLGTVDAYTEAKQTLKDRYGDSSAVATAFRSKLESWTKINARDGPALRRYADFLRQCETAMSTNESLKVLDDMHENRKMTTKLPEWLVHRWGRVIADVKEREQKFPPFSRFVKFVTTEAKIACEPTLQGLTKEPKSFNKTPQQKPSRSLATEAVTKTDVRSCVFCGNNHKLDKCQAFLKKSLQERKDFIKTNGLCFGCMKKGHRSKECKHRLICETCKRKHPSALHGDTVEKLNGDKEMTAKKSKSEEKVGNIISHASHLRDTTSTSKCTMIVPVWISHRDNPQHERMVYALLDTQSDTTFILEDTCKALGVPGTDVKLLLSTMSANRQMIDSQKIVGLQVRAYK